MKHVFRLAIILCVLLVQGCGWIQTLRREVEDDGDGNSRQQLVNMDFYKDPANRYVPPPPASALVSDARTAALQGSPVDLSGTRAKHVRATAENFMADAAKNENSLWSEDGQNNYLFARNKLKQPGDLVTVVIEDPLRRDMVDSVKRLLPPEYRDEEIRVPGLTKAAATDTRAPAGASGASGADAAAANPATATTAENLASEDILTAEVLERYPNGNVKLRGIKRVPFKTQVRNIEVVAICKGTDITETDMVKSSRFFDQHVEIYR